MKYTAVIKQHPGWWVGWVEEVSGVNSRGGTREELIESLPSALREAIEMNRAEALAAAGGNEVLTIDECESLDAWRGMDRVREVLSVQRGNL